MPNKLYLKQHLRKLLERIKFAVQITFVNVFFFFFKVSQHQWIESNLEKQTEKILLLILNGHFDVKSYN